MLKHVAALTLAAAALLPATANAWYYEGNPDLHFRLDRAEHDLIDGSVLVNKLRVTRCNGTYVDYTVNAWVDPVKGYTRHNVIGGDLCSATWYLQTTLAVAGPGFVVQTDTPTFVIDLDPFDAEMPMPSPYVKGGDFWGTAIQVISTY